MKGLLCSWIRRLTIVKRAILPKVIHRPNVILIKIHVTHFTKIGKLILKFIWKCKGPQTDKTILKKKKLEDLHFLFQKLKQSYIHQKSVVLP